MFLRASLLFSYIFALNNDVIHTCGQNVKWHVNGEWPRVSEGNEVFWIKAGTDYALWAIDSGEPQI